MRGAHTNAKRPLYRQEVTATSPSLIDRVKQTNDQPPRPSIAWRATDERRAAGTQAGREQLDAAYELVTL